MRIKDESQIAKFPLDKMEFEKVGEEEKKTMLARAYRIVHASVGDTVTRLEIERLYGKEQDGHKAYQHLIDETSEKLDETCIEASFVKEVEKIEFLSQGAKSGSESHIHDSLCWR